MSTIVMRVDLDCAKCYKKIRKALCKIQDKASIRTISFDEKSKTVTISGPFDAEEVADRLSASAGKIITDMHLTGGGGNQKHLFDAPTKNGKVDGHGHGGHGGKGKGKPEKGHGGFGSGGGGGVNHKQEIKGHGGFGSGGGGGVNHKQEIKGHGGYGGGGGGKQETKGGHGGFGGGKPDKKHVKFDFDDMSDDDDDDDLPPHAHHGGGHGGNPKIVKTTTTPAGAATAPMRMPGMMMAPQPQPQAMATPSIWPAPAAPEWGYSAPQYGGPPAGGYYGVPAAAPAYGYGGYGAPAYGYGRSPYGAPPQYSEEEPSAACIIL